MTQLDQSNQPCIQVDIIYQHIIFTYSICILHLSTAQQAWVTKQVSLPKHKGTALASAWCCSSVQTASWQTRRNDFCAVIHAKCNVRFSLHQRQMNFEGTRAPHQSRLILRVQVFEHMFRDYHLERSAFQNSIRLCLCSKPKWRVDQIEKE